MIIHKKNVRKRVLERYLQLKLLELPIRIVRYKMKIATYNIWNSQEGMPIRGQQIYEEIKNIDADIICLQEVALTVHQSLSKKFTQYENCYFMAHKDDDEGLAIYSKTPFISKGFSNSAVFVTTLVDGYVYKIINVHLPWDSILRKEQLMVDILEKTDLIKSDYSLLTGDFNCSSASSVHQFICGQTSLLNKETKPYWHDLAEAYSEMSATPIENTINFHKNPRWCGLNMPCVSGRFDRIYLCDAYPSPAPQLIDFKIFGKAVHETSTYAASDHYGVLAEITHS